MYVRFPLSLRNVEDLLHERGIDISHETVRFWWNRFGPMFAAEIRRKRVQQLSRNNGARTSRCHWLVRRSIPVSSKDIKKRGWHPPRHCWKWIGDAGCVCRARDRKRSSRLDLGTCADKLRLLYRAANKGEHIGGRRNLPRLDKGAGLLKPERMLPSVKPPSYSSVSDEVWCYESSRRFTTQKERPVISSLWFLVRKPRDSRPTHLRRRLRALPRHLPRRAIAARAIRRRC